RQIIARVSQWLAATLTVKTDVEKEQEALLAQHLAAEQLRNQIETLQNYWDGSGDPKYLRQQTRVIAALARLGVVPGAIDALAADATIGPYDPSEPQTPWSEDEPCSTSAVPLSPVPLSPAPSSPPLPRDCSPSSNPGAATKPATSEPAAATADFSATSDAARRQDETDLRGLTFVENRLLKLIADTLPDEYDRLAS